MNILIVLISYAVMADAVGQGNLSRYKETGKGDFLSPRPVSGKSYDNFKSFFGTIFRYMSYGLNFLKDKINKVVVDTMRSNGDRVNYRDYQVLRIDAINEDQVEHLKNLHREIEDTEFWTPPTYNSFSDLLVSPDSMEKVKEYLKEKNIDYEILIRDLQKVVAFENPKMNKIQRNMLIAKRGHPMTWMRYHRYSDMLRYMEFLAFNYPQHVQILTIGHTTEGLPLRVIKVFPRSYIKMNAEEKRAIWIDGGMHGREWITPSVVLYIVRQLVENYNKHKEMTDATVWFFLPVANPDGYEYSHSFDRLWKKTRSVHDSSDSNFIKQFFFGSCEGVDLNKNFDYHWGENGISIDPCGVGYAGPEPLSEPESRAISDFIMLNKNRLRIFISLHSYSQKFLIPWSYTTNRVGSVVHQTLETADYKEMEKMAKKAAKAISLVTGSHYDVGPSASFFHPVSGTAADWAKGVAGIKYCYSIMLRDRGSFGFLLPAAEIVPTAKEIFVALKVLSKFVTEERKGRCGAANCLPPMYLNHLVNNTASYFSI